MNIFRQQVSQFTVLCCYCFVKNFHSCLRLQKLNTQGIYKTRTCSMWLDAIITQTFFPCNFFELVAAKRTQNQAFFFHLRLTNDNIHTVSWHTCCESTNQISQNEVHKCSQESWYEIYILYIIWYNYTVNVQIFVVTIFPGLNFCG